MKFAKNLSVFLLFFCCFSMSYADLGILPLSLKNNVAFAEDTPSITLTVKNIENQQVSPFYFVLYDGSYQIMSFFGKHYRILSSQFQGKNGVINNFCGLAGREISEHSLAITLSTNPVTQRFHCKLALDGFN